MKRGFTPTVHNHNREIVRISDTMYIGVPKTGRRCTWCWETNFPDPADEGL